MVALAHLDPEHPLRFLGGWVRLQLTRNPGAAFSLGEGATAVFAVVAVLALVAIVVFALPRLATRLDGVIMAFLMAGIGGNLVDRLCRPPGFLHGYVIDFIWVSHFAIFNVADVFITCAAIAIGIRLVFFGGSMGVRTPEEASLAVDGSV
jgi:signal peptidase II